MTVILPQINSPTYQIELPVSKIKLKIRPFMAREEKILLMAMENKSVKIDEIKSAILQIITNCVVGMKLDVDMLPSVDIEYIFMQLRKRSVGETIELAYDLRETFECATEKCPETYNVKIKIDDIKLKSSENIKRIIKLNDTIGVVLKPMSFATSMQIAENSKINESEKMFEFIACMVTDIFDGDNVIDTKTLPKADLLTWIETSFSHQALEETLKYINELPYFSSDINVECKQCGKTKTMDIKGMVDFFTF